MLKKLSVICLVLSFLLFCGGLHAEKKDFHLDPEVEFFDIGPLDSSIQVYKTVDKYEDEGRVGTLSPLERLFFEFRNYNLNLGYKVGDTGDISKWKINLKIDAQSMRVAREVFSRVKFLRDRFSYVENKSSYELSDEEHELMTCIVEELRGEEFFNVAEYPYITFRSEKVFFKDGEIRAKGVINIRGVEREYEMKGLTLMQRKEGGREVVVFFNNGDIWKSMKIKLKDFGIDLKKLENSSCFRDENGWKELRVHEEIYIGFSLKRAID